VGFDVDGVCTCDPNDHSPNAGKASCVVPPNPLREGGCDYDGGIDDSIVAMTDAISTFPGLPRLSEVLSREPRCGHKTIIFGIFGYNGLANDPHVSVHAVPSYGMRDVDTLDGAA